MKNKNKRKKETKKQESVYPEWAKSQICIDGEKHKGKMVAGDYFSWGVFVCSKCGKRV